MAVMKLSRSITPRLNALISVIAPRHIALTVMLLIMTRFGPPDFLTLTPFRRAFTAVY